MCLIHFEVIEWRFDLVDVNKIPTTSKEPQDWMILHWLSSSSLSTINSQRLDGNQNPLQLEKRGHMLER